MAGTPKLQQAPDVISVDGWRKLARVALALYVIALACIAGWCYQHPESWSFWANQGEDSTWIVAAVSRIGAAAIRDLVLFLVLGFLCGSACASSRRGVSIARVLASVIAGFALAVAIAVGATSLMRGMPMEMPTPMALALILLASFWGSWLGATWMNSSSSPGWAFKQAVLAVVLLFGGLATLTSLAISTEPGDIASETVSTEDRRRLVAMFRQHDPRKLEGEEISELTITERDLNQLAGWGFSLLPSEHHARVQLADQQVTMEATLEAPSIPLLKGHLNVVTSGAVHARKGELVYSPLRFKVGRVSIPQWLFRVSGPIVLNEQWQHGPPGPFLRSLQSIDVGDQVATIAYRKLDVDRTFMRDTLVEMGVLEDLEESCNEQVSQLIVLAEESPRLGFTECVQTAFATAHRRSKDGGAARENRAAILALAYLLGHQRVRALVGELETPSPRARRRFNQVKLRNRRDWTQHFTISAAVQVLGNTIASLDVGILKEELDADGGSGFSFGDLMADRAGTEFAVQVTKSEDRAKAMQIRISSGFQEEDFVPPGSDLPEGLSAREFDDKFGGVGGTGYTKLLNEIDQRIAALPGYSG